MASIRRLSRSSLSIALKDTVQISAAGYDSPAEQHPAGGLGQDFVKPVRSTEEKTVYHELYLVHTKKKRTALASAEISEWMRFAPGSQSLRPRDCDTSMMSPRDMPSTPASFSTCKDTALLVPGRKRSSSS
ncbi:MAG: hypothetical protein FRX49_02867 [Trebouxia sp. A1-2]|nr:MAG: hypothetical protein FRX49_02867 [Trebouxia sp. A1-2]